MEVLKKENDPCGCWFPGIVASADGNNCIVRYKGVINNKGEPVVERVHGEDVRPRPPIEKGEGWKVGDIAEVFDIQCWRVAKIVKVLKNVHFVVRLFGSIQLREFHKSNLRIRQAWHNNKWSVVGKVGDISNFYIKFLLGSASLAASFSVYCWFALGSPLSLFFFGFFFLPPSSLSSYHLFWHAYVLNIYLYNIFFFQIS